MPHHSGGDGRPSVCGTRWALYPVRVRSSAIRRLRYPFVLRTMLWMCLRVPDGEAALGCQDGGRAGSDFEALLHQVTRHPLPPRRGQQLQKSSEVVIGRTKGYHGSNVRHRCLRPILPVPQKELMKKVASLYRQGELGKHTHPFQWPGKALVDPFHSS